METETRTGDAGFYIENKRDPELHKEFKLCHTKYKWTAGSLTVEGANTESATVKLDKGNWGKVHTVAAVVTWLAYELPDKSSHVHQQVFEKSRDSEFIAPEIEIKTLSFNHKVGHCEDDGIDIQMAHGKGLITAPEYVRTKYRKGIKKTAAYKKGISGKIEGVFAVMPSLLESAEVFADGSGLINSLKQTKILKSKGFKELLPNAKPVIENIDHDTQIWTWEAKKFQDVEVTGWEDFDITSHPDIFVTLEAPVTPWGETGSGKEIPWVSALTFAIDTCKTKGKKTKLDAISQITTHLKQAGGWSYNTASGYPSTCWNLNFKVLT